jgi:hypothetical protein
MKKLDINQLDDSDEELAEIQNVGSKGQESSRLQPWR